MRNKSAVIFILSALLLLNGCTNKPTSSKGESKKSESQTASEASKTETTQPNSDETNYYAPYTGEQVSKEVATRPAFLSIIENSAAARPQSGFTEADIVFEAMAEGGITRCLALYQKDNSAKIGPVRSMRTYFIDIAYEYNLPFAHAGGSHDALDRIAAEKSMTLNYMANVSSYWRDTTIKIQEHNLYTSSEKILALIEKHSYSAQPNTKLSFDKPHWDNLNAPAANNISVRFNTSYTTAYNFKDGLYYKSMNNKPTENKEDKKPVAVKNVVIQNVKYSSRSSEPYLDAALIGSGDGYIISNGKAVKVTWSKADLKSQTIFKDENGNVVQLNPGKTWWHLLDQNAKLTIN